MEREPNSRRFWRLNTIAALRSTRRCESEALDSEDFAAIRADNAELVELEGREKAVRAAAIGKLPCSAEPDNGTCLALCARQGTRISHKLIPLTGAARLTLKAKGKRGN